MTIKTKDVQNLLDFLKGEKHKNLGLRKQPKLSNDMAESIIYYLQEVMKVIPDTFEQCSKCKAIFEFDSEGDILKDKLYCENCLDEKTSKRI